MTTDYYERLVVLPTATYFDQLLELTGPSKVARSILLARAEALLELERGMPDKKRINQIRDTFRESPSEFYRFVSTFLADFPPELLETDRYKIVDGLTITVKPQLEFLKVNEEGLWIRHLTFQPTRLISENDALKLAWLNAKGVEIVPFSIYEFLRSAMVCYRAGVLPGAIALAAIAFEATLKETLKRRDALWIERQGFKTSLGQIDAYREDEQVRFEVKIEGAAQKLRDHFKNHQPRGPKGWLGNVKFQVRRDIIDKTPSSERRELALIPNVNQDRDLLASNIRNNPTKIAADRFEQYNNIASARGLFLIDSFSPESAEVLRQVRNKIIHWDDDEIENIEIDGVLLIDFIQDVRSVQTTLANLAEFVSNSFYDVESMVEKAK